jgi:hypothetical protein
MSFSVPSLGSRTIVKSDKDAKTVLPIKALEI